MERLTAKLGPLPVWAWGIIIGATLIALVSIRRGNIAETVESETVESDARSTVLTGYDGSGIPVSAMPGGQQNVDIPEVEATNSMWLNEAIKIATAAGIAPLVAERALRVYLEGGSLTTDQQKIINPVITKMGLPPEGLMGTPSLEGNTPAASYATVTTFSAPNTAKYGKAFTVKATVRPADPKAGRPTGTVQFIVDGQVKATRTVYQSGTVEAAIRINKTSTQSVQVRAKYVPTGNWKTSSAAQTVIMKK